MPKNNNNQTKIEVVINQADYSTANTIDSILVLDKAGLIAASGVLASFFDMYRWWRLEKVETETCVDPVNEVPMPFYTALIQPDAVTPTDALDFETPTQHLNSVNGSAAENKLIIGKPALAQIGSKMPTHSDAAIETLDSYGTIFHGSIGNNLAFTRYSKITVHIVFFVLTDPDTLATQLRETIMSELKNQEDAKTKPPKFNKAAFRKLQISEKQKK